MCSMEDTIKSVMEGLDLLEVADPSDRRFIGAVRGLIEGLAGENRALKREVNANAADELKRRRKTSARIAALEAENARLRLAERRFTEERVAGLRREVEAARERVAGLEGDLASAERWLSGGTAEPLDSVEREIAAAEEREHSSGFTTAWREAEPGVTALRILEELGLPALSVEFKEVYAHLYWRVTHLVVTEEQEVLGFYQRAAPGWECASVSPSGRRCVLLAHHNGMHSDGTVGWYLPHHPVTPG